MKERNIIREFTPQHERREILDWFHLMENLHKVGGSIQRINKAKSLLWQGKVDDAIALFADCKIKQAENFCVYLEKRGWDIYHPHQPLIWHYYNEKCTSRPLHWEDNEWVPLNYSSAERFRKIFGLEERKENFGIYGLGENRTLSAYLQMCDK